MPVSELDNSSPPSFGYPMLEQFAFDKDYINLNHGSYGSAPKAVLKEYARLTDIVESNPDKFHRLEYQLPLIAVRERLAKLIGAETDEVVLVPNASYGLNTILRDLEWKAGDVLVEGTHGLNVHIYDSFSLAVF